MSGQENRTSRRAENLTPRPPLLEERGRGRALSGVAGRNREISEGMLCRARRLRAAETTAEAILWNCLRGRGVGVKFRRQHVVGRFVLDFYSIEANLAVELDGSAHDGREDLDAMRTRELELLGVRLIWFTNDQVENELESVLARVKAETSPPHANPLSSISPSPRGETSPPPGPTSVPYSPSPRGEGDTGGEVTTATFDLDINGREP